MEVYSVVWDHINKLVFGLKHNSLVRIRFSYASESFFFIA